MSIPSMRAALGVALVVVLPALTGFTRGDAWNAEERAVLASMSLDRLPALPRDLSNAVEEMPAAAALGRRLRVRIAQSASQR